MHLSLLGTFCNNEDMVETICELHGKQELELYRDGILKLVSWWGGLKQCAGGCV